MYRLCVSGLLFFLVVCSAETKLEDISDENLHKSLETEPFVIVLFLDSKTCDEQCEMAEKVLVKIREDLVDALSVWVTKTWDSPHLAEFGVDSTPAVVFFRRKNPMVYDGKLRINSKTPRVSRSCAFDEDEMYEFFTANREPTYLRSLNDDTFEHLTQASSGATTGDWLVMFHTEQCEACPGVRAKLETVGARVKDRMTVALVNRDKDGAVTGRRFKAYADPTLIL
ncbi:unnamed protein product [Notodromas monacha]|uniref:Thioredoxin domain-containing protein n=1 Tax=Notodromas monacha TaxID=399045 RepID=A0A7R9BE54_9CRUS|nr:unnamed protein product [Notodromas monacha]CAG0913142.1 unnamed protein product [Notodromas monacha]